MPEPTANVLISQLVADDPDMIDLVEEFVGGLETRLADLKAAHARNDYEQLKTLAHQLKGAGGSYGYPQISELAANVEPQFAQEDDSTFEHFAAQLLELIQAARRGLPG